MGKSGAARAKSGDAAYGSSAVDHELRLDFKGASRRVRDVPPLVWSPYAAGVLPAGSEPGPISAQIEVAGSGRNFTMMDAYAAHVEGARRSAGAGKLFQHALLQFPTDLEITPESEREMLAQGVAFINLTYGGNAAYHARLDRDEKGRHTVDVFFAPRYQKTTAKGTEDWISLSKFSKQLARDRFGQREKTKRNLKTNEFEPVTDKAGKPVMVWNDSGYFQGRALQDAFFEHLRDSMGLDWAERGQRKKNRDHDRLEPEEYAAEAERERFRETVEKEAKIPMHGMVRLKEQETPYTGMVRDLVKETRQKATESAAEALDELREEADSLEASLAPARAAVAAMDAFKGEVLAYNTALEASKDAYRVTDVYIQEAPPLFQGRELPRNSTITATSHATGETVYWRTEAHTAKSAGDQIKGMLDAAKAAGKELWVKVMGWAQSGIDGKTVPKGIDILDGPPPAPPRKPTLAREVLQLLSLFDEKGLGAVRDLEPQEQPLQAPVRIK